MKAFEVILTEDLFLRIHKSYIVNLDKIVRLNSRVIELENQHLPLSRNRKSQLVEALTSFYETLIIIYINNYSNARKFFYRVKVSHN